MLKVKCHCCTNYQVCVVSDAKRRNRSHDNWNGAPITAREFASDIAKFKHVLVHVYKESLPAQSTLKQLLQVFHVAMKPKASQTNPNLLLLLLLLFIIYVEASNLKILLCCLHLRQSITIAIV